LIWLAIDTAAHLCAAALYDSERKSLLAQKSEDIGRGHAERLIGLLDELLDEAGIAYKDIDQIGVTRGPGSFTGIRVGLATARGLALGLDVSVVGVSVLNAIAYQYKFGLTGIQSPLMVALDARRGEVFMQTFAIDGVASSAPMVVALENIATQLPKEPFCLAGSGSQLIVDNAMIGDIEIYSNQATAGIGFVAELAATLSSEDGAPVPLYLRQADAKPQNNFAVQRAEPQDLQKMNR